MHFEGKGAFWEKLPIAGKIGLVVAGVIGGLGLFAGFGWLFMQLWNWIMPSVFGLGRIDYWQGWGVLILSAILFHRGEAMHAGAEGRRKRKLKMAMQAAACECERNDDDGRVESK
jgi:hypothetical protein